MLLQTIYRVVYGQSFVHARHPLKVYRQMQGSSTIGFNRTFYYSGVRVGVDMCCDGGSTHLLTGSKYRNSLECRFQTTNYSLCLSQCVVGGTAPSYFLPHGFEVGHRAPQLRRLIQLTVHPLYEAKPG